MSHRDACRAAGRSALLLRPLRQAPRLEPLSPHRRRSRTLAPIEDRQGEAQARDRSHPRGARSPRRLPHRHRAGLRHRRGRDGAVVAARRATGHHARLGIVRRRLGERRRQGAQAQGRDGAQGRLRRASRSRQGRSGVRRGLHLERHHLGRAGAERAIGSPPIGRVSPFAMPPRPASRRRSIGAKLDVVTFSWQKALGRRGGARHADPVAARGRAPGKLHAALAAAENLPADQGRQAQPGYLRRRDHQYAVDAVRRGLSRHARLGEVDRRA